ncbi:hypothetical protein TNCT_340001 [Trichonephila clavata]|uniref:Uncharacterized protein n=1 Tax=Trichonephila clavata TaxID=2740835 RepID=A0A8X6L9R2_TRICU|nr:hypothetical protein TNCT_340001 [Trichonephila clavata]
MDTPTTTLTIVNELSKFQYSIQFTKRTFGFRDLHQQGVWVCGTTPGLTFDCIVEIGSGIYKSLLHYPSILSPRHLPVCFRPYSSLVVTISCPLLSTCSDDTLRMIDLESNTARQPTCVFHADDQTLSTLLNCTKCLFIRSSGIHRLLRSF